MELAFAGLQQLCAPLLNHLDELPEPQREALNVAFGRGVGATPDRFLVGLAVLSLMAAAANDQPLLCIVDDAQWLDEVSVQTLAFVARRLLAEPVAVVFAARDGGAEALAGLPELVIRGLSDGDARDLLESVMVGRNRPTGARPYRGRDAWHSAGPARGASNRLGGGAGRRVLDFGQALVGSRDRGRLCRAAFGLSPSLPSGCCYVAAAEPVGDAALFLRAAAQMGIPVDALAPAEAAGVIEFGPRMRFHHPLMRSAAYRAADLTERRTIHRALADATDPQSDPDRRAWHAANAAAGPDDAVAAELETSAGRAQSRGGIAAAAAFLERATALTSDPALRSARAVAAAQAKRDAAAPAAAYELLAIAELGQLSDLQQAQVARLRAQMEFARSRGGDTGAARLVEPAAQLLNAAKRLEPLDDDLARETYLEALAAAMYAGRLGEPGALVSVAEAARAAVGRVPTPHRPIDLLLSGMANRIVGGMSAGSDPIAHRVGAHVHASPAGRWPSAALDVAGLGHRAGIRHRRTLGRCDLPSTGHRRGSARAGRRCTGRTSTGARLPRGGPPAGRRIRHGGNSYRRGSLDHRCDRLRATEVPRTEPGCVAGDCGRRGRADRGSRRGRNRQR